MIEKRSLLEFSPEELKQELIAMGEKPFRAVQVYSWLTQCRPFSEMSNLSKLI